MRSNPGVLPSSAGLALDEVRWRKRNGLEPRDKVGVRVQPRVSAYAL